MGISALCALNLSGKLQPRSLPLIRQLFLPLTEGGMFELSLLSTIRWIWIISDQIWWLLHPQKGSGKGWGRKREMPLCIFMFPLGLPWQKFSISSFEKWKTADCMYFNSPDVPTQGGKGILCHLTKKKSIEHVYSNWDLFSTNCCNEMITNSSRGEKERLD